MSKRGETTSEPTIPIDQLPSGRETHVTVAATYRDPVTSALYVHRDLVEVNAPWADEGHVKPMKVCETFGDVESFARYVQRFGIPPATHLTWNREGFRATLDYADEVSRAPGRGQWQATMPFARSLPWCAWASFANNAPLGQKLAVERIEDLAGDVVSPAPADLMALLRSLRATVNAKANAELRPDGTTTVAFERDARVQGAGAVELPASFAIAIPVLKGHTDEEGRPVVYRLDVRLRVGVGEDAKLTLRFAIPNAERVLESVYADRVALARELFGAEYELLRASDG